jgi:hypothetical protein
MSRCRATLVVRAAVAVALLTAALIAADRPPAAVACSAGPDYNPVRDSAIIVAGRITGWELGEAVPVHPPPPNLADAPLWITMRVDHVLKGGAPRELTFADFGSLVAAQLAEARYPGLNFGVGGCAVFLDEDPTDRHVVLGLARRPDGSYLANRLLTFYVGDAPGGADYQRALDRLAALGPVSLPRSGAGVSVDTELSARATAVAIIGVMLAPLLVSCLQRPPRRRRIR